MSNWSRKYKNNADHSYCDVSEETKQYIKRLKYKSNYNSLLEEDDEDDITAELMFRIETNQQTTGAPKEVRAARKVIQNWLEIENEAECIRHKTHPNPKTRPYASKLQKIKSKKIKKSSSTFDEQSSCKKIKKSSSAFEEKFAKMKINAMKREKKENVTLYASNLLSTHKQISSTSNNSKSIIMKQTEKEIAPKRIAQDQYLCEHKEEEESVESVNDDANVQNIHNAEQTSQLDLIPSSKFQIDHIQKQQNLKKKLETKKILLFQLHDIEKQEIFHNKKSMTNIMRLWKQQIKESQEIEAKAESLYRNNLMKHTLAEWMAYIHNIHASQQVMIRVFREWLKKRLISQDNNIRAIEFYEYGLQDNVFFIWRDFTKQTIEASKIRRMQIQARLYKMNKIAARHHRFATFYKIIRNWKQYTNSQQNQKHLQKQREQRKLKIQKLISSVKQKPKEIHNEDKNEVKVTKQLHHVPKKSSKSTQCIQETPVEKCNKRIPKKMHKQKTKHIQTKQIDTTLNCKNMNKIKNDQQINHNKEKMKKKTNSTLYSLKPSKIVTQMEERALLRKHKRDQMIEIKKQKQREHEAFVQRQKQLEIEKIKEAKRMEKEQKLERLQKQKRLKEIENNKLILSQLHHQRALLLYRGWIPWMQRIEINNIHFHRIVLIRNCHIQKRLWNIWRSVIHRRTISKLNAQKAAYIGREMISARLFVMKVETKYWSFWREIILKYKMMNAMIVEKRKLHMIAIYFQLWVKHYELTLNKKQRQQLMNEEIANKRGDVALSKRVLRRWKHYAETRKKEKIKARTWRKVEVWLTELRANR